jgi:hypothetical protein
MHVDVLQVLSLFSAAPFLAVAAILVYYRIRRMVWKRNKRRRKKHLGFCPSSAALGMAFLVLQVFHRPSMAHVVEARQVEDAEEDDEGDPEGLIRQLNRQLRRIRRGEPLDRLVLRL